MAGMTINAPDFMLRTFDKFKTPPDIDLEGREIRNIEETEEIDPEDNCRVHVTTYTIISNDGTEESRITKRRKLKVNCTQHTKRLEYSNGKEANVEEKTEYLTGDVGGLRHTQFESQMPNQLCFDNDKLFSGSLLNKNDDFLALLVQKKDMLQKMYPGIFSKMRTQPSMFDDPSGTETINNPDGTVTTRIKSSKAFSSRISKQETYVNGVKQHSKLKYRAFAEYKGPGGGFCVNMRNSPEDDLSEDETEDDDLLYRRYALPDSSMIKPSSLFDAFPAKKKSMFKPMEDDRFSHSDFSEITDATSALISDTGKVPKLKQPQKLQKHEKAFHAANEIVDSEARYVSKLALLEKFRTEVDREKILDKRQMNNLFANISSLYQFHNQHLLPQLLERARDYQTQRRISDVFKKQAPFMKIYSEYTNNYKSAMQLFEDSFKKKKKFQEIVLSFEKMAECENLPLMSHMICPVQRVMRYQMLLKEYIKYLSHDDADYEDTEKSLELVLEAASHANEMMRRLDRYKNVLEVQELLGNSISLVSPGRELLKRAKLMKISSSNEKVEERDLFIFNDIILVASERSISLGSRYRIRAIFDALYTQICDGDNLERENSFYIRGSDSQNGRATRVELFTDTSVEKKNIIDCLWSVISEVHQRKKSFSTSMSANSLTSPRSEKKNCSKCETDFSWFVSSVSCNKCGQRFCKKCFGQMRQHHKRLRVCEECIKHYNETLANKENNVATTSARQDVLGLPADSKGSIKAGMMTFKGPCGKTLTRYFVLRANFCLYSYVDEDDDHAVAMLPLSGCEIEQMPEKLSFSLRHMNRMYQFTTAAAADCAEWMAALELSANAALPSEDHNA